MAKKDDNEIRHDFELGKAYKVDGLLVEVSDVVVERVREDDRYLLKVRVEGKILED